MTKNAIGGSESATAKRPKRVLNSISEAVMGEGVPTIDTPAHLGRHRRRSVEIKNSPRP